MLLRSPHEQILRVTGWIAMLASLIIVGSGCGTACALHADANGKIKPELCYPYCEYPYSEYRIPRVYSGAATVLCFLRVGGEDSGIVLPDLPVSFAADTIVLPYTITRQIKSGDLCAGAKTETPTSP